MSDKVTKALQEELALLRAKLEQTDIYKEIQILERMIARRQTQDELPTRSDPTAPSVSNNAVTKQRATPISQVKLRISEMLAGAKLPISTKEIFSRLQAEGIIVPGDSPQNNLSAHLSRDNTFISWGRSGWTLAREIDPELGYVKSSVLGYLAAITEEEHQMLYDTYVKRNEAIPDEVTTKVATQIKNHLGRNLVSQEEEALANNLRDFLSDIGKTRLNDLLG
jgi:hypothetical protein